MTKIKLCGLSRPCDIDAVNRLLPDYIGFVFAKRSRRHVTPEQAAALKRKLSPQITAVGVFVNEAPETIAALLTDGVIDMAQLHGTETTDDIQALRSLTEQPIVQAFQIKSAADCAAAERSPADLVLLDAGAGCGQTFDWRLIQNISRPYFLAGGLTAETAPDAIRLLHPYAVDTSSGIETDGYKDYDKMSAFVHAVRSVSGKDERS